MTKTIDKAKRVLAALGAGQSVESVKKAEASDDSAWQRISTKAYELHLKNSRKKREEDEKKTNVSCTSNDEIESILALNEKLADYALSVPPTSTMAEVNELEKLVSDMSENEHKVIAIIEVATMSPRFRALQKKGRLQHFSIFKEFSSVIEAATISYYRENFISSYLTLVPVIEGILLRWLGYSGGGKKPEFDSLKKFFKNSNIRQPCPGNALFHEVYIKACDKILTDHLYKSSENGSAYSNFNRHLAAHLLSNSQFATKDNCIRLFMLIDVMTEIFHYEVYCPDYRFNLTHDQYALEMGVYERLIVENNRKLILTAEQVLLGNNEK